MFRALGLSSLGLRVSWGLGLWGLGFRASVLGFRASECIEGSYTGFVSFFFQQGLAQHNSTNVLPLLFGLLRSL